jgi:hypothetical protein
MRYSAAFGRQETIMYKKFDLESAKNGAPVITRSGKPARIICFDRKPDIYPLVALVQDGNDELLYTYARDGNLCSGPYGGVYDLFMAQVKKKGWVNVYPPNNGKFLASCSDTVYESKDMADSFSDEERIACVEIEWSE